MPALDAFLQLLKTTVQLARTRLGLIALAAVLPFIASHLGGLQARGCGMPERLVLDLLHGFIVLSYLTAAVRIAQSRGQGIARFGFAWPKPHRLGVAALLRVAGTVVLVGLPLALALHPAVQAIEAAQATSTLRFPVTMLPEFVMTTWVGLVLAGETSARQS